MKYLLPNSENMQVIAMDSMSLKIHSFLKNVGVPTTESSRASDLVAYFEKEYGLKMMGFLEAEWLNEQLERDTSSGTFAEMRPFVNADQLEDYDEDVELFSTPSSSISGL